MRKPNNSGGKKPISRKTRFYDTTKVIISGKWEKSAHAVHVPNYISTLEKEPAPFQTNMNVQ